MNIQSDKSFMIFRKDGQFGTMYSLGLSKKDQSGKYINGYMTCRFRKGIELDNKTIIIPKKWWLDWYLDKEGRTMFYVFIDKFEKEGEKEEQKDPFKEFGEEIQITSADLPF